MIRPESWSIDPNGDFEVEVIKRTFLGQYVEYEVNLNKQRIVFIDYFNPNSSLIRPGSKIRLNVNTNSFKLLKK